MGTASIDEAELYKLKDAALAAVADTPEEDAVKAALSAFAEAYELATEEPSADLEEENGGIKSAVDAFCDEVSRPVGKLNWIVPQTPQVDRAITKLHDVIGRGI